MPTRSIAALTIVATTALALPALLAQAPPRTPAPAGEMQELLAEVRALRDELAAASRTSLRTQMLVARVQLQEQRIMYFDRRRAELAEAVGQAAERTRRAAVDAEQAERHLQSIRGNAPFGPPTMSEAERAEARQHLELMAESARRELDAAQQHEARLRAEDSEVAGALTTEQGRWSDFNARLDDLERALPR